MDKLEKLTLKGFKSIKNLDLSLGKLNVLIGANGAGKSNLISFFKMMNEMIAGRLQHYVGASGRAQSLLYYGSKVTPQIEAKLDFRVGEDIDTYSIRLFHVAGDTLMFAEEKLSYLKVGWETPREDELGAGHQEAKLKQTSTEPEMWTAKALCYLIERCRVYHFHDTSSTASVRQYCYVGDNRWLMPDAGNLAALLLRFQQDNNVEYRQIVETIRLIAPFFDDFILEVEHRQVTLNWISKDSERVFGAHQFSDGTLRAICLITLLLQPTEELPKLIVVDEPELGLHPYALNVVADLFHRVSTSTQVLISTQSSNFLDNFDPENIIAVNYESKESKFQRFSPDSLDSWLEEYSLGEIWEKNIIGGGPH